MLANPLNSSLFTCLLGFNMDLSSNLAYNWLLQIDRNSLMELLQQPQFSTFNTPSFWKDWHTTNTSTQIDN